MDLIQGRHVQSRDTTFNAVVQLIRDIETAQKNDTPKAQFLLDYVESENSTASTPRATACAS